VSSLFAYSSPYDGYSRAACRVGLASIAWLVFLGEAYSVASMVGDTHFSPRLSLPASPAAAWGLFLLITLGLVGLALDRFPIASGVWALAWMSALSQWQIALFGSPSRNSFFPGAAIFGWVLGLAWARIRGGKPALQKEGRHFREALAEAGAVAGIAAAYVGSASSKLLASGFGWANANQVRYLILSQEPLAQASWILSYRQAILNSPTLGFVSAAATLLIEGGGFLLLCSPRLRLLWSALIWGLHLNILVLCTMPYLEPMALVAVFSVPWPRLFRRPRVVDPFSVEKPEVYKNRIPDGVWILLTSIIVLAWVLPIGWPRR